MNKKTAFVLSGGGSRGAYEVGVWQALNELGIKIDIVTGASVGAINGAMIAQGDFELATLLWREIETHMVFDVGKNSQPIDYARELFLNKGAGSSGLQELIDKYLNEDGLRNSQIEYGLVTVELPSLKPHFLFAEDIPKGLLKDYITASASAFPAVHSHKINGKEFIDGGYADVLPVKMALSKGATDVIAVYLDAVGIVHPEDYKDLPNFTLIKSKWDLGNFLVFDKANTKKITRLGYLDALKAFGVFDGEYYALIKGAFDKRSLKNADLAGKVFELDASLIYGKAFFLEKLKSAVDLATQELSSMSITLKDVMKLANRKTAVLLIADSISEKGADSIFLTRHALRVIPKEIGIARFLIRQGIIPNIT